MSDTNGTNKETVDNHIIARTVSAESYFVVDKEGKTRFSLCTAEDGTPVFTMMDKNEQDRLTFFLDEKEMPVIMFFGNDGIRQFDMTVKDQGKPHLRLFDGKDQVRVALYVDEDRPSLNFYDNKQILRMAVYLADDGRPYVSLLTDKEEIQTKITAPADSSEGLTFEDKTGNEKRVL